MYKNTFLSTNNKLKLWNDLNANFSDQIQINSTYKMGFLNPILAF